MFREMEAQYATIRQNNKNLKTMLNHLKTQVQPVQESVSYSYKIDSDDHFSSPTTPNQSSSPDEFGDREKRVGEGLQGPTKGDDKEIGWKAATSHDEQISSFPHVAGWLKDIQINVL